MKKKLLIILPVVLLLVGGGYKFVFAKEKPPEPKVHGIVYPMGKEFLINPKKREHLKEEVLHHLEEHTDVKAHEVLFTDMAVQ